MLLCSLNNTDKYHRIVEHERIIDDDQHMYRRSMENGGIDNRSVWRQHPAAAWRQRVALNASKNDVHGALQRS